MLSRGVEPPERHLQRQKHQNHQQPQLRHGARQRTHKNADRRGGEQTQRHPNMNSGMDPSIGTPSAPFTINISDSPETTCTTSPIDQTFAIMISNGVIGHHQQVFHRTVFTFAYQRRTGQHNRQHGDVIDDRLTPPNHAGSRFGLKRIRVSSETSGSLLSR